MAYDVKIQKEELVKHLTSAVVRLRVINLQEKKDDAPAPLASLEGMLTTAIGNINVDLAELDSKPEQTTK